MAQEEPFKYVFGPVPSRRLGRSLGVDVVPYKTCTYDCTYCQVGRTTVSTIERRPFVPLDAVLDEVRRRLEAGAAPDYITISGSGEPTLYAGLGPLIRGIKAMTDTSVAVITNGSLLWMPEVREDLALADLVVPSLDAGTANMWQQVDRPANGLDFDRMVDGLATFRDGFKGQIWLEVFLLGNANGVESEVRLLAGHVKRIRPDRIQINTVARPPADSDAQAVPKEELERFALLFDPPAEVIADFTGAHEQAEAIASSEDVLDLLRRRPCSLEDIAQGMRIHRHEASKYVGHLLEEGRIHSEKRGDTLYYVAEPHGGE